MDIYSLAHSKRFKEACRLHKALAPIASVHKQGDTQKLLEHTRAIVVLSKGVEADAGEQIQWREDVEVAVKALGRYVREFA